MGGMLPLSLLLTRISFRICLVQHAIFLYSHHLSFFLILRQVSVVKYNINRTLFLRFMLNTQSCK